MKVLFPLSPVPGKWMGAVSKLLKATIMNGETGVKGIFQCAVCALGTKVTAALLFSCKHLKKEEEKRNERKKDSNEIVVKLHKLKSRGSNHSNKYKYHP